MDPPARFELASRGLEHLCLSNSGGKGVALSLVASSEQERGGSFQTVTYRLAGMKHRSKFHHDKSIDET